MRCVLRDEWNSSNRVKDFQGLWRSYWCFITLVDFNVWLEICDCYEHTYEGGVNGKLDNFSFIYMYAVGTINKLSK